MGFKFPKLVIFSFYAQIMPRRLVIDSMHVYMYVLCKPAGNLRLNIFVHVDILILVSEFVVVAIYLSGGYFF